MIRSKTTAGVIVGMSIVISIFATGCTDRAKAGIAALGQPGEVTCYSGGKEIYHGFSTGKVFNAQESDGYEFMEAGTNRLIRITADCIVKN